MEDKKTPTKRRLEKKSGKTVFLVFCSVAALLIAAIFFLYPREHISDRSMPFSSPAHTSQDPSKENLSTQETVREGSPADTENQETPETNSEGQPQSDKDTDRTGESLPAVAETSPVKDARQPSPDGETAQTASQKTADIKDVCAPYLGNVENFFDTLDSRSYIHDFNLGEESKAYFPELIQKLADNPPVVTGETNDLYTVLKNTAHFFRIIGKKNILVLKGILDREKDTFEQILADFYYLTQTPQCLNERFNLDLNEESLYLYSGFFLNTMGGRLYLFRRDSKSRMVVNFYAILIIDHANRTGKNKYGIPLSEAIDSLIEEIESTRIELRLRDYYLDSLYDMKEKYQ